MNRLEAQLRRDWIKGAAQDYLGRCDTCLRTRDDRGNALRVIRQRNRRGRECFGCWVERTEYGNPAGVR